MSYLTSFRGRSLRPVWPLGGNWGKSHMSSLYTILSASLSNCPVIAANNTHLKQTAFHLNELHKNLCGHLLEVNHRYEVKLLPGSHMHTNQEANVTKLLNFMDNWLPVNWYLWWGNYITGAIWQTCPAPCQRCTCCQAHCRDCWDGTSTRQIHYYNSNPAVTFLLLGLTLTVDYMQV